MPRSKPHVWTAEPRFLESVSGNLSTRVSGSWPNSPRFRPRLAEVREDGRILTKVVTSIWPISGAQSAWPTVPEVADRSCAGREVLQRQCTSAFSRFSQDGNRKEGSPRGARLDPSLTAFYRPSLAKFVQILAKVWLEDAQHLTCVGQIWQTFGHRRPNFGRNWRIGLVGSNLAR